MTTEDIIRDFEIDDSIITDTTDTEIFFKDSDDFAKIYSLLSTNDIIELIQESVVVNSDMTSITFENEDYEIILSADFTRDIYKITLNN